MLNITIENVAEKITYRTVKAVTTPVYTVKKLITRKKNTHTNNELSVHDINECLKLERNIEMVLDDLYRNGYDVRHYKYNVKTDGIIMYMDKMNDILIKLECCIRNITNKSDIDRYKSYYEKFMQTYREFATVYCE